MANIKTKIVIDADVIIHFIKGGYLSILPNIFPTYEYVVLSIVLDEVCKHSDTRIAIQNHMAFLKTIKELEWNPVGEMIKEFANLIGKEKRGDGESACMVYCKYNKDVVASSNLRDIKKYCDENMITYVTTMDFLHEAFIKRIMTEDECNKFISDVIASGSKLPNIVITNYSPRTIL